MSEPSETTQSFMYYITSFCIYTFRTFLWQSLNDLFVTQYSVLKGQSSITKSLHTYHVGIVVETECFRKRNKYTLNHTRKRSYSIHHALVKCGWI